MKHYTFPKLIRCIQMYKNTTHMVCIRNSWTQIFVDVGFCMHSFCFWLKQVQPWQIVNCLTVGLLVWLTKTTLKLNTLVLYRWTKWGLQHHPSAVPLVAGSPDELALEERMWVTVHLMLILQQNLVEEATAVPDFPALASTVRCTLIPTQKRTPPVSTTL